MLIDGMASAVEVFERLDLRRRAAEGGYHTIAGFALYQFQHLPQAGESFEYEGWRFEVVDTDGRRIDKIMVSRLPVSTDDIIDDQTG